MAWHSNGPRDARGFTDHGRDWLDDDHPPPDELQATDYEVVAEDWLQGGLIADRPGARDAGTACFPTIAPGAIYRVNYASART